MKRLFTFLALVLGLVSCQTEPEGFDVNVGGEQDVNITVSLPESTRADSAKGFDLANLGEYSIRYILEISYNEHIVRDVQISKEKSVKFPVRLAPNKDYTFTVWADLVTATSVDKANWSATDNFYNTSAGLSNITFNTWTPNTEARDAYTKTMTKTFAAGTDLTMELKRPFAKVRVVATDIEDVRKFGIEPDNATVSYATGMYESFNAVEGKAFGTTTTKTHNFNYDDVDEYEGANGEQLTVFADYILVPADGTIQFSLDVKDGAETIKPNSFNTAIPVEANKVTTIKGHILTDGGDLSVDIEDTFDNAGNIEDAPYYQQTISSVAELLAAINANDGEYILISNLDVNGVTASTLAATRATGDGPTINLNGYTITLKTNITIAEGKTLTINDINDINENGAIINAGGKLVNYGTLNIEGGEFGENTIENNNGVVNITGGTINGDLSDFVPDGYDVKENEDGSYTVTESEPVAQIGNETYTTLQAAFDAVNGEATITLLRDATFKNTSVLANGKTVVLDLNGKTLAHTDEANQYALSNLGTLTITGNGTVNSRGIYNGYGNGGENVATAQLTIENGSFNAKGTNGGAAVFNYGIVNVNGGEFTSIGGYSLNNQSGASMTIADGITANNGLYATGATITINGGEISGNRSGCHVIYANNSTVTINGGTLYNNNSGNSTVMAAGSTKITYNGGTYGIKDGRVPGNGNTWTSCLLDSQNSAEVVVNDGTYNGGFRVQAGTSMTINGGSFNDCYGSNYNINGTVTVKGGTYTDAAAIAFAEKYVAKGYMAVDNGDNTSTVIMPAAKVGSTIYTSIDEAIAAWTNNATLTLLNDVELSDVITLKSTEHHILDLSTYTLTAAEGKNAFVIKACGTGDAERTAITIKADATNPGGINAGKKCVVYYKYADGGISGNDRPIIKIEGGVFTGSTSSWGTAGIYTIGTAARKCATLNVSGGVFDCSINGSGKSKLLISGGVFNYSVGSQGDSTALRLIWGGKFKTLGFMTADSENTKFWFGTSMANSNVGLYVDDEGYLVVGGPVITEFGDKFAAKATNPTKWNSLLQYSSAAANGLYYTNADAAIAKHGEANVVVK